MMRPAVSRASLAAVLFALAALGAAAPPPVSYEAVAQQVVPLPTARLGYGSEPQQFGELRLPKGDGPFPVVVLIHGGCWLAEFDLAHLAGASEALRGAGFAVWTIEYRRVGDKGGGWPGTFEDVARAIDATRAIAKSYPIDAARIVLVGHSAGGHLALWAAGRQQTHVRGVVGLAAITDLREYASTSCGSSIPDLLGGSAKKVPDHYAATSPIERTPLGVPVRLVHGSLDDIVPIAQSRAYEKKADAAGDNVRVIVVEGAGHFDVVAPFAPAWQEVERAVRELAGSH